MSLTDVKLPDAVLAAPELLSVSGRIANIVGATTAANATAARIRQVGAEDARLRGIQAGRLQGRVRASFAARGVSGGSQGALERETATLESNDVERTIFAAEAQADEVRRRGLSSALGSTLGIASDALKFDQARDQQKTLDALKRATVLKPGPEVL